jgi:DNA-binding HxlR family transcriptional regulator
MLSLYFQRCNIVVVSNRFPPALRKKTSFSLPASDTLQICTLLHVHVHPITLAKPMSTRRITKDYFCSIEVAVDCISGKWKPAIVYHLKGGPLRFTELLRLIPRASRKVLAAQLRELEADGLVDRKALEDEVPKGVEYSLTDTSRTLLPVLQALHEWGVDHARRHRINLYLSEQDGST